MSISKLQKRLRKALDQRPHDSGSDLPDPGASMSNTRVDGWGNPARDDLADVDAGEDTKADLRGARYEKLRADAIATRTGRRARIG